MLGIFSSASLPAFPAPSLAAHYRGIFLYPDLFPSHDSHSCLQSSRILMWQMAAALFVLFPSQWFYPAALHSQHFHCAYPVSGKLFLLSLLLFMAAVPSLRTGYILFRCASVLQSRVPLSEHLHSSGMLTARFSVRIILTVCI